MGNCVSDRTIEEFHNNKIQEKQVISFLSQNKLKIIGQTLDNVRFFLENNGYTINYYNYRDSNKGIINKKIDYRRINLEILNGKVIKAFPSFI
jgi:hypothetical protein